MNVGPQTGSNSGIVLYQLLFTNEIQDKLLYPKNGENVDPLPHKYSTNRFDALHHWWTCLLVFHVMW